MKRPHALVFEVRDKSGNEGLLKVLQGNSAVFRRPRLAGSVKAAQKTWNKLFPKNELFDVSVSANEDGETVVHAKVRAPIGEWERGVAGVRSWMFVSEKYSNEKE